MGRAGVSHLTLALPGPLTSHNRLEAYWATLETPVYKHVDSMTSKRLWQCHWGGTESVVWVVRKDVLILTPVIYQGKPR